MSYAIILHCHDHICFNLWHSYIALRRFHHRRDDLLCCAHCRRCSLSLPSSFSVIVNAINHHPSSSSYLCITILEIPHTSHAPPSHACQQMSSSFSLSSSPLVNVVIIVNNNNHIIYIIFLNNDNILFHLPANLHHLSPCRNIPSSAFGDFHGRRSGIFHFRWIRTSSPPRSLSETDVCSE